jgi:hypothetical protein
VEIVMNALKTSILFILPAALGLGACGAAGTQPHDMSSAQHEAAAKNEDSQSEEHASQYDAAASETTQKCTAGKGRVCWKSTENPTEEHKKTAEEHRELAAKHRAASQALLDAETRACKDIPEEDRDMSPFSRREDIQSVSQLREETMVGKGKTAKDAGATVVFRATPGLTAEWLQRIVDCHIARNAAVGHDMPEMSDCPLVPKEVQAKVRSVGDGFAVDVRSDNAETAAEIWKRAQKIVPAP